MAVYDDDLRLAHVIADSVDALTMARFQAADLVVDTKPDLTPVTDADRAAEELVRAQLRAHPAARRRPSARSSAPPATAPRRWVVDPIDGTKNYVRGVPVWATLIALSTTTSRSLGLVVGAGARPALVGRAGSGAWTGRSLVGGPPAARLARCPTSRDASLSYSDLVGWERARPARRLPRPQQRCWRTRAYGDFWSYMLVAEGAVDVAAEPDLRCTTWPRWCPIVTEAGGRFTSLDGVDGPPGGSAVATNGRLHDTVLPPLRSGETPERHQLGASSRAQGRTSRSRRPRPRAGCPGRSRAARVGRRPGPGARAPCPPARGRTRRRTPRRTAAGSAPRQEAEQAGEPERAEDVVPAAEPQPPLAAQAPPTSTIAPPSGRRTGRRARCGRASSAAR